MKGVVDVKNRYVISSILFMLVLLAAVVIYLPKTEQQAQIQDVSYEEKVFKQNQVTSVDITVDESGLKKILENPMDKEVVPATVTIDGKKVADVGFRTKGNMTLRSVANMEDSDRYSFKIDFDYYHDGQNLYGLKKLALNNNYSDSTLSREYLSYKLMEKMGIATPKNSYMYVTINGKEWGLYLGVEAIDETFLQQHFKESTGDLYKPDGTGSDLKWISNDIKDYTGLGLKTNEDTSDQSAMMKLLDVINNGGDLNEVMDVDEMLRYFAANTALVNLDHYQGSLKHNYYLYEKNGIFSILPWDYNMSFGGFGVGGGAGGMQPPNNNDNRMKELNGQGKEQRDGNKGGMMESNLMNDKSINFSITTPVSGTTLEDRPLLNALLGVDEYREMYNQYLKEIADTFFTEENMQSLTNQISSTILSYVEKDPTKFTTTEQFLEGISGDNSIVAFAVKRAESINKQLSGELVVEENTDSRQSEGNEEEIPSLPNNQEGNPIQPPNNEMDRPQGFGQAPPFGEQDKGKMPNDGQMPPINESNSSSIKSFWILFFIITLLVIAIVSVFKFKRRR